MKLTQFLFFLILLISCSASDSDVPTDGPRGDTIHLSVKNVDCDYEEQAISVSTKGWHWWFDEVDANGTLIEIRDSSYGLNPVVPYSFMQGWFSVLRDTKTTFLITLTENKTGNARKLDLVLQAYDFWDRVVITQRSQ